MAASYPSSIKSFSTKTDNVSAIVAADQTDMSDEIVAIETELGITPSGSFSDVVSRLLEEVASVWAKIDQVGTQTLVDSYNVSGIVDSGTGVTDVTIDHDMDSATYAVVNTGDAAGRVGSSNRAVGSYRLNAVNNTSTADIDIVNSIVYGGIT